MTWRFWRRRRGGEAVKVHSRLGAPRPGVSVLVKVWQGPVCLGQLDVPVFLVHRPDATDVYPTSAVRVPIAVAGVIDRITVSGSLFRDMPLPMTAQIPPVMPGDTATLESPKGYPMFWLHSA